MKDLCIIGAGLAGILLAQKLKGQDLVVLEKSKGIGGRIASRRLGGHAINHGAVLNGLSDPHAWIKDQAATLPIERSWEVARLEKISGGHKITGLTGKEILARHLVLAIPAPQAKKLLPAATALDKVTYSSMIQLMLLTSAPPQFTHPDLELLETHQADEKNYMTLYKLRTPWQETDKEEIKSQLLSQIKDPIIEAHVHKWRYCEALTFIDPIEQLRFAEDKIYLIGDYFESGGIEAVKNSVQRINL